MLEAFWQRSDFQSGKTEGLRPHSFIEDQARHPRVSTRTPATPARGFIPNSAT